MKILRHLAGALARTGSARPVDP